MDTNHVTREGTFPPTTDASCNHESEPAVAGARPPTHKASDMPCGQSDAAVHIAPPTSSINIHEDGVEDTAGDKEEESSKLTWHQKITFLSALLATLADVTAFSIISPFFPLEAEGRGMSSIAVGFTFSIFSFTSFLTSPLFGKILPIVGARFLFLSGSFVCGGSCILFGFIDDMPSLSTFTIFCFLLRAVTGIGAAAGMTASSAIIAYTFPKNVGMASSVNEMMAGIGSMIGPAVGGLLYSAGGFKLPFIVLGVIDLAIVAVNFFLMPNHGGKNEKTGSIVQCLRIPAIWATMICICLGAAAIGFLDPTLSPHLKKLGLNVDAIGFVFLGFGALYGISSVIWGYLADKTKATRIIIVMGLYGGCVSFLIAGPSPYLHLPFSKYVVLPGLFCGSITISMIIMPSFLDMLNSAQWYGIKNDLGLNSVISGLWTGMFSLGSMIGPILGGALKEGFGFEKATTFLASCCIFAMLLMCFFGVWEYRCGKGKRVSSPRTSSLQTNSTDEEHKPLLGGVSI